MVGVTCECDIRSVLVIRREGTLAWAAALRQLGVTRNE